LRKAEVELQHYMINLVARFPLTGFSQKIKKNKKFSRFQQMEISAYLLRQN
jgi:hypothetical protein